MGGNHRRRRGIASLGGFGLAALLAPGQALAAGVPGAELSLGIPAILGVYLWIIWRWGFGPEDRVLFKR